ncbi:MAG: PQQ-binding-like beta-propeller repeat protein [Rhodospirillaceae bacterium]|nr:PQQ-binding-like beta-propeller repeat protein [Rhodospirillaceae bacterium]
MKYTLRSIGNTCVLMAAAFAAMPALAADLNKPAGKEWPAPNGDLAGTRFSTLTQVTPANVKQLGGAWLRKFEGAASRANPVVAGGLMFVTAGANAYGLNPKTGETVWSVKLPTPTSGMYKGVATGEDLVFIGLGNAHIIALRQKTGEKVWEGIAGDDPALKGQAIPAGPTYANGLVIAGVANGDYGLRGRVVALDAKTGKEAWRFHAIPGPGDKGFETWPSDNDEWKRGGGGVWMNGVVDSALGLIYFGVGNPVPQWGGELRKGDNLYSDSILALDIKTGELKWHYQVVHHDIWEADLGTPPVLFDGTFNGKKRKALSIISAAGFTFTFDRATGEPLIPIEERPVPQNKRLHTSPTQPFPVGVDQLGPRCVPLDMVPNGYKPACLYDPIDYDMPNIMYPIVRTRAAPMAVNPETGHIYATAAVAGRWYNRYQEPKFFSASYSIPGMKSEGLIAAVNAHNGKVAWEHRTKYRIENGSGFTATKSGLLFHGDPDGHFQAFDAKNGEKLWEFQTGANASGTPGIYEADGEQYVATFAGGNLWAFKLGGSVAPQPAPEPPPTVTTFAGRIESAATVKMGVTIADSGLEFVREAHDEFAVRPLRNRVAVGEAITFVNGGKETHTAMAADGTWTTGPIAPGQSVKLKFDKAGTYTYICKDHPWTYAQLIVGE